MRTFLVCLGTLLWCTSASAQVRDLLISGVGANSCAQILKQHREGPKAMGYLTITWAQGFWSSQNAMMMQAGVPTLRNLAIDSDATIKALMDECGRQPSLDFGLIVRDYFFKLPSMRNPNAK